VATANRDLILRAIDIAHALGAPTVRTYAGKETGGPGRDERLRRLVEMVRRPAEIAAKAGVRLGFENHFNTLADSAKASVEVVAPWAIPASGLSMTRKPDDAGGGRLPGKRSHSRLRMSSMFTSRTSASRTKPPETTSDRVDRLPAEARPTVSRILGEGILPWKEILRELHRTGYDGYLSMEYERRWYPEQLPPAEIGMRTGAELVRQILKDLGGR